MASRNSEILTKTSPYDFLHHASKPYGSFIKYGFQDFEVEAAKGDKPAVEEKVFVVTSAVAKRGKRVVAKSVRKANSKDEETTIELEKEEVIEALMKYNQKELIDKWQAGEIKLDPLFIKVLLGKVTLKVIALPTTKNYEPWTLDLLKWIRKKGDLNFDLTRKTLWNILRHNLSGILPKKSKHSPKNPLRHFRISHLVEYYQLDPYELTTYAGWTARSTFAQMGISASPNIDVYAHLRWRMYFPKLLKPISQLK